ENFDGRVINGLLRRFPDIDLVRVVDVGLSGALDPEVLQWAAEHGRVVLIHDAATMVKYAFERLNTSLPMPGVVEVPLHLRIRDVVDDLVLLDMASLPDEWNGKIIYLPLGT